MFAEKQPLRAANFHHESKVPSATTAGNAKVIYLFGRLQEKIQRFWELFFLFFF